MARIGLLLPLALLAVTAVVTADVVRCSDDVNGVIAVCPEGNTCCLGTSSTTCCPLANATCCINNAHCCPENYECQSEGYCRSTSDGSVVSAVSLLSHKRASASSPGVAADGAKVLSAAATAPGAPTLKLSAQAVSQLTASAENHLCPDGRSQCSDSTTCCATSQGDYGCCGYSNGVCCSDHVHCCPPNTECVDGGSGGCMGESLLASEEGPAGSAGRHPQQAKLLSVAHAAAPSKRAPSAEETEAAPATLQRYGRPQRPAGAQPGTADKPPAAVRLNLGGLGLAKVAPSADAVEGADKAAGTRVVCPNGQVCPDNYTCCSTASGDYGCCGLPNAVCCADHIHCCPHNSVCNGDVCEAMSSSESAPFAAKQWNFEN